MLTPKSLKEIVERELSVADVDCTVAVALKIIDKKCQMDEDSKALFMQLYDAIEGKQSKLFDQNIFLLISQAREKPCLEVLDIIHQKRLYVMDQLNKSVMKAYKRKVRELVNLQSIDTI